LPDYLNINSDADIEAHADALRNVSSYSGSLTFGDVQLSDLEAFGNLEHIDQLSITRQEQLDALRSLRSVKTLSCNSLKGDVIISNIEIIEEYLFVDNGCKRIDAPDLKYVGHLWSNNTPTVLGDFSKLEEAGLLYMHEMRLESIEDFSSLHTVEDFSIILFEGEISPGAFASLRKVDRFSFVYTREGLSEPWIPEIDSIGYLNAYGHFTKDEVCEHFGPLVDKVVGDFDFAPYPGLQEELGLDSSDRLNADEVRAICF